jgi:hypothetical protein
MIVTVVTMRMVQTTINDVVNVIAMRNRFMTAARAVHVAVCLAPVDPVLAAVRVGLADGDDVLVIVNQTVDLVRVVEMAVVQVVDMVFVAQGLMPAAGAVTVIVVRMGMAVLIHR